MWEERLSVPCLKINIGEKAGPARVALMALSEHEVEQEIQSPALLFPCLSCGTCGCVVLMVAVVMVVNWTLF